MQRTLIIFLKAPGAGRVKTRLGRGIGMSAAAWWYRHQVARLIRRLAGDRRWQTVLAVAPHTALRHPAWPAALPRMAQGSGDLGARMARALAAAPPGPKVLVGGDIPGLGPAHIARAFRLLGGAEAVFGPSGDGGFWMIGLRNAAPSGFLEGVRWSGPHALADSIATLPGRRIALADQLDDVDEPQDLHARDIRA